VDEDTFNRLRMFSRRQAYAAGISRREFDAALAAHTIVKWRRTVFASARAAAAAAADPATAHAFEVEALIHALSRERIAAAGTSAGQIHGLPLITPPPKRLIVCTSDPGVGGTCRYPTQSWSARERGDGYALRPAPLPPGHVVRRHHVPVTSVARTLFDLAGELSFAGAVAATDAARHDGLVTLVELTQMLTWGAGRPGIDMARKVVQFSDPRAESPLESVSRVGMHVEGVPPPELQVEIFTPAGEFVARADFLWRHLPVLGESDGMKKFLIPGTDTVRLAVVRSHFGRHNALVDMDFELVRWGWDEAMDSPRLAARLFAAFERAEARIAGRRVLNWKS
jgi:hypothetical protein